MGLFSEIFGSGASGSLGFGHTTGKSASDTAGSSNTVTTAFDDKSKAQLDQFLTDLITQHNSPIAGYDKQAAINDVKGNVDWIFQNYRENSLPQILSQGAAAGVYNATGVQALANQAYGQAVGQAASLTHQAIKDYAGIVQNDQQLNLHGIISALGLEKDAYSTQKTNATSSTTTKASSNSLTGSLGLGK